MGYKVLVDELTVHQTVGALPQPDGSTVYQNGLGETYLRDEVIDDDLVAEDWKAALESGEGKLHDSLSKVLEQTGDEPELSARRLGVPFEGYDDMEEEDILSAMKVLPSAAIVRIKEFEASRDEPRENIAGYNIGFGESPLDRQEDRVGGDLQEGDEDKAVARLTTRDVPEEGPVVPGEGITGTGDPDVGYGSKKDEESGEGIKGTAKARRRGRRDRQPKPPEGAGPGESSIQRAND
jgi:hypothetical protein